MQDNYFGTKELYEVVLKANTEMMFGQRKIEVGEPVLYFENISMAQLNEQSRPIMARGGWGNMPHVIWEDRSEMTFSLTEGVMNSVSMGILMSAKVLGEVIKPFVKWAGGKGSLISQLTNFYPFELENGGFELMETPAASKRMFCFEVAQYVPQRKVDFTLDGKRVIVQNGDADKEYIFDYYYRYGKEVLIYLVEKERFNGTFSLEGKFYTKDENDGLNRTNIIFMPKVRIVSDINLRLGERTDPTVSVFNVIAMPEKTEESKSMLMKITRLGEDIDGDF